jgi:hypothetical protein
MIAALVGDPLSGLAFMPIDEFESKWLFVGIVLKRVAGKTAFD